ncbi:MAG: threonine ammonia-lyase [Negativicutes bacterium]|nr:threonine ammonia-lyase [Negativicutes bacterium]
MDNQVTLSEVQRAYRALRGVVRHTPLSPSTTFSEITGMSVFLKMENLQRTGSFKLRGAYNKIHSLSPEEKARGVIAASAGNHAQGVAYGSQQAGIRATICMPVGAPLAKVKATRSYGAEVVLAGAVYDEAYARAREIEAETGMTFVHAFDDPKVIAGQGTIGVEILDDMPDVDAIVVPIGGGGIIGGIALAVKEQAPHIKIFGAQAAGAPAMFKCKQGHCYVTTESVATIADGIAVREPGKLTWPLVEQYVDDVVTVEDEMIAKTILQLMEMDKVVAEGAGATALAALAAGKISLPDGSRVVAVLSGGNIDVNLVSRIIERGLIKSGRSVRMVVPVLDKPGNLSRLLSVIAATGANIIQISQDRLSTQLPFGQAMVELGLETRDHQHIEEILTAMEKEGFNPFRTDTGAKNFLKEFIL